MSSRPGQVNFPLPTYLKDALDRIQQLLRGRLTLHDNVSRSHIISYTHDAGAGNAETIDITALGLTWTPTYFVVVYVDASAVIWATAADVATWSKTQIVLRSSANAAVKVMIF